MEPAESYSVESEVIEQLRSDSIDPQTPTEEYEIPDRSPTPENAVAMLRRSESIGDNFDGRDDTQRIETEGIRLVEEQLPTKKRRNWVVGETSKRIPEAQKYPELVEDVGTDVEFDFSEMEKGMEELRKLSVCHRCSVRGHFPWDCSWEDFARNIEPRATSQRPIRGIGHRRRGARMRTGIVIREPTEAAPRHDSGILLFEFK